MVTELKVRSKKMESANFTFQSQTLAKTALSELKEYTVASKLGNLLL